MPVHSSLHFKSFQTGFGGQHFDLTMSLGTNWATGYELLLCTEYDWT